MDQELGEACTAGPNKAPCRRWDILATEGRLKMKGASLAFPLLRNLRGFMGAAHPWCICSIRALKCLRGRPLGFNSTRGSRFALPGFGGMTTGLGSDVTQAKNAILSLSKDVGMNGVDRTLQIEYATRPHTACWEEMLE
jgi:hypothetical protein